MTTKTFSNIFEKKESAKKILSSQYVLVSSRIKKNGDNTNVVSVHKLFPKAEILADYRSDLDPGYFAKEYRKQLVENNLVLAVLVQSAIAMNSPIMFLCTPKEYKLGYFKLLSKYVDEVFQYPMLNYKKYKTQTCDVPSYDPDETLKICDKIISQARKDNVKKLSKTVEGRRKLLNKMSKDEMIQMLKGMNLYCKGLSKSEMENLLEEFFVSK